MVKYMKKPKIAFFDFACCEGCQLTVLRMNERLFDLIAHVRIVSWREVMTEESADYDIAFCEGSINRRQELERIRRIRETADILVSLGTCASIGCHNALKNHLGPDELRKAVYSDPDYPPDVIRARPITAVVPVDYQILGCPVSMPELATVFKQILTGQEYRPPNQPVCVECKLNDNLCVFEKGLVCMGPVTRCGCNAVCTAYGDPCQGCRGLIDDANLKAAVRVLTGDQLHSIMIQVKMKNQLTEEEIRRKFAVYNNWPELKEMNDEAYQGSSPDTR
ncbi:MAG: hypothetical protein R6U50_15685 [Desulfobacterales bacterium]